MGQAALAHFTVGTEEFRQVEVGGHPGHTQVNVPALSVKHVLESLGLQSGGRQTHGGQILGQGPGDSHPGRVVGVYQNDQLLGAALFAGGDPVTGEPVDEFQGIVGVLGSQRFIIIRRSGRAGQGNRQGHTLVGILNHGFPVNAVGQEGTQGAVVEMLGVENVAADVHHVAAFNFPQLVVAAVFGKGIAHGVGADHADITELEFVTDLGCGGNLHQIDGGVGGSNLGLAAPPGIQPLQYRTGRAFLEGVGAGAQRHGSLNLAGLDNGDIHDQGQILEGGIQLEDNALAVLGDGHFPQVEEAVFVVVVLLGLGIGGDHVLGGDFGTVGEGGVFIHVEGPVPAVGRNLVGAAEDGGHVLLIVHGEQRLVHQAHEHPVGIVGTEQRVHGAVRIVGQGQLLSILFLRHNVLRFLAFHQDGIAGGDVAGIVDGFGAAAHQARQQGKGQQKGKQFFHHLTSLQVMTAPWEPRSPLVTRWDQNR